MAYQDVRAGRHHYRLIAEPDEDTPGMWQVMGVRDGEIELVQRNLNSESEARQLAHNWALQDASDPSHECSQQCQSWQS